MEKENKNTEEMKATNTTNTGGTENEQTQNNTNKKCKNFKKPLIISLVGVVIIAGGLFIYDNYQDSQYSADYEEAKTVAENDGITSWNDFIDELMSMGFVYNGIGFVNDAGVMLTTNLAENGKNYASIVYENVSDAIESIQVDGYVNVEEKAIEFYDMVINYVDGTQEVITSITEIPAELEDLVIDAKTEIENGINEMMNK